MWESIEQWLQNHQLNAIVKTVWAALSACIATALGGWAEAMTTLVVLMAADYVSGWIRAAEQKKLSSTEAGIRTARKFAMVGLMVVLGAQADVFLGTEIWRNAVVLFYCGSEGLSIIENVVAAGVPVPDKLRAILKQLNERKYVDDEEDG